MASVVTPNIQNLLVEHLKEERGEWHKSAETRAWLSEALQCARKISFRMTDAITTEPFPASSQIAMWVGDIMHTGIQAVLKKAYPGFQAEVYYRGDGLSGRLDGLLPLPIQENAIVEIKSMVPYPYDRATKGFRGAGPQGPDPEHAMQAALASPDLDATWALIIYANKAGKYNTQVIAQWLMPIDDLVSPQKVQRERERLAQILDKVVFNAVISAPIWQGELISDPIDQKWPCAYCRYRSLCAACPIGEITVDEMGEVVQASTLVDLS